MKRKSPWKGLFWSAGVLILGAAFCVVSIEQMQQSSPSNHPTETMIVHATPVDSVATPQLENNSR